VCGTFHKKVGKNIKCHIILIIFVHVRHSIENICKCNRVLRRIFGPKRDEVKAG
jgi:hypothetical protein